MLQEQTKNLTINIVTGVIVVGVIVAGYFVFRGKQDVVSGSVVAISPTDSATQTVAIGLEIARTVRDLKDLKTSVESSATVFNMTAFKNLKDFSVEVISENVGTSSVRSNPFVPTDWKLKEKALEDTANKQAAQANAVQTVSVSTVPSVETPTSMLGDFSKTTQGI